MKNILLAALTGLWMITSTISRAEELVMDYRGIDLLGNIEMGQGVRTLKGQDIVLILHDTQSSKQENLISAIQMGFKAQAVTSLAINLSLGLDMRKGRYDCKVEHNYRHKDALGEMAKWIKWLMRQGVKKVHLIGQGRGANQVALYARSAKKSKLGKMVLISPLAWTFEKAAQTYHAQYRQSLQEVLQKAKGMIADKEGDMLMDVDFLRCPKARVTANTFEDYYAPNAEYFTPSLLDTMMSRDILVVTGEYDTSAADVVSAMQTKMGSTRQKLKIIAGSDKNFGGIYKDNLVAAMVAFFK